MQLYDFDGLFPFCRVCLETRQPACCIAIRHELSLVELKLALISFPLFLAPYWIIIYLGVTRHGLKCASHACPSMFDLILV